MKVINQKQSKKKRKKCIGLGGLVSPATIIVLGGRPFYFKIIIGIFDNRSRRSIDLSTFHEGPTDRVCRYRTVIITRLLSAIGALPALCVCSSILLLTVVLQREERGNNFELAATKTYNIRIRSSVAERARQEQLYLHKDETDAPQELGESLFPLVLFCFLPALHHAPGFAIGCVWLCNSVATMKLC